MTERTADESGRASWEAALTGAILLVEGTRMEDRVRKYLVNELRNMRLVARRKKTAAANDE